MGCGGSPIVRMPQGWSRWWPQLDVPHQQNFALCLTSLHVYALPLRRPPCQQSDITLMEVSQRALDLLCIRTMQLLYITAFTNLICYLYLFYLNKLYLSLRKSLIHEMFRNLTS